MKKIIIIIFAAIIVALIIYRIATQDAGERVKSISEIQKENGVPVEVAEVVITNLNKTLNFTGTVEGIRQSDATAKIGERVVELKVEIGDRVEKDQIIAKLDPESPQLQISQAELAVNDAERELQRMESLHQQGAISRQTVDKFELARDMAAANLKQLRELLKVTAPISGVVTEVFYREGESPHPGEAVVRVAEMKKIRVEMEVSPSYRLELKKGQKAYIYLTIAPDIKIEGRLDRVSLSADPESRNFQAYVAADNADEYLPPGVSVEVEVIVAARENILAVHRDALTTVMGKTVVYLANDKARMVEVQTGITAGSYFEIVSGLEAGQRVVVHGQNLLSDGDPILVVDR